jgi:AcrR family transcriptional regulator
MTPASSRKSGPERREQIARAALDIMGREGLAGISTAALASAVGLSTGALFRHFESRDAILDEAIRLAEARVERTFPDGSLDPIERLRALARARIDLLSQDPGVGWLLRSSQAQASLPPTAVKRLQALVRRSRRYIRTALSEAAGAGVVRTDVSQDVLLLIFTSTVHALIGKSTRTRGLPAPAEAVDGLLALLQTPTPAPIRS